MSAFFIISGLNDVASDLKGHHFLNVELRLNMCVVKKENLTIITQNSEYAFKTNCFIIP